MKRCKALFILLLLLAACLPAAGHAEPLGECVHFYFETPLQTEHVLVESIVLTRFSSAYVMLDILYRLPDSLPPASLSAIQGLSFRLMADAEGDEPLTPLAALADSAFTAQGPVIWRGPDRGMESAEALVPGAYLLQESQWAGLSRLPAVLYIRPYFSDTDSFGDLIELDMSQGLRLEIQSPKDVPPPLTEREAGWESNG